MKEFRKNRTQTGQQVNKSLSKAIRDQTKLAKNYRRLGHLALELGPGIILELAAPQGFADFLKTEGVRLSQPLKLAKIAPISDFWAGIGHILGMLFFLSFVSRAC